MFSWRILWLLGLPTGAIIIFLNRFIPESPRFLAAMGRHVEAARLLHRFAGQRQAWSLTTPSIPAPRSSMKPTPWQPARPAARAACAHHAGAADLRPGLGPGELRLHAVAAHQPEAAGHRPGCRQPAAGARAIPRAAWRAAGDPAHQRWSSFKALVLFIVATALALFGFAALAFLDLRDATLTSAVTAALLVSVSGVIAMLVPYAAEIYPVHLRAAARRGGRRLKFGGILGPCSPGWVSSTTSCSRPRCWPSPLLVSAFILWRSRVETRGIGLEDIPRTR